MYLAISILSKYKSANKDATKDWARVMYLCIIRKILVFLDMVISNAGKSMEVWR
jgi:hypothetical protein